MNEQEKRDKVVGDLTWAINEKDVYDALYADDLEGVIDTMKDAVSLLKEQEPVIPKQFGVSWFCGRCKTKLVFTSSNKAAYCWRCGKAVKWGE